MNNVKLKVKTFKQNMNVQKKIQELNKKQGRDAWYVPLFGGDVGSTAITYPIRVVCVSRNWAGVQYLVIDGCTNLILCFNEKEWNERKEKIVSYEEFIKGE